MSGSTDALTVATTTTPCVVTKNKNLQVSAYVLTEGIDYVFALVTQANGYAGSASVNVTILPVRPIAAVQGGNRLVMSGASATGPASDVILDASKSRNANFSPLKSVSYLTILFRWTCFYRRSWNQEKLE